MKAKQKAPAPDFDTLGPDAIKSEVFKLLSNLPKPEQETFTKTLWREFTAAHINFESCLFTIGVGSLNPTQITPYEVAHLARYVCLQQPKAQEILGLVISLYGGMK